METSAAQRQSHARQRRIARTCFYFGAALAMSFFLLRDALPRDDPWRELADDSVWIIAVIAGPLMGAPSFVAGLIEGVQKETPSHWIGNWGKRHSWTLIATGTVLCAVFGLGQLLFDSDAEQFGGWAGILRSHAILVPGIFLISWGWARPDCLFLEEREQHSSTGPAPNSAR